MFADKADADYAKILAAVGRTKEELERIKRFDMPGFRPRPQYVRELKHYGIVPAEHDPAAPLDVYAAERAYWKSLWHRKGDPSGGGQ